MSCISVHKACLAFAILFYSTLAVPWCIYYLLTDIYVWMFLIVVIINDAGINRHDSFPLIGK
jgi:hypothetical protein